MSDSKGGRYDVDTLGLDAPIEFYDLSKDIEEAKDLAKRDTEIADKLARELNQARTSSLRANKKGIFT